MHHYAEILSVLVSNRFYFLTFLILSYYSRHTKERFNLLPFLLAWVQTLEGNKMCIYSDVVLQDFKLSAYSKRVFQDEFCLSCPSQLL